MAGVPELLNMMKGALHTLHQLTYLTEIPKESCRQIVVEDLQERKLCTHFVSCLTDEQNEWHLTIFQDLLQIPENNEDFINNIVTGY